MKCKLNEVIRHFLFLLMFLMIAHLSWGQNKKIFSLPEGISRQDIEPNVVVVKVRSNSEGPDQRTLSPIAHAHNLKKLLGASTVDQLFPGHETQTGSSNSRISGYQNDISNIYKIYLNEGEDVVEAINILLEQPDIVYAEPYYIIRPLHEPNDPQANQKTGFQDHLKIIKAYDAWAITKGDTNIVIGVLDTGYNPDHEDLKMNIKNNHKDPLNNFDDDDDGYKDNFAGWDFANGDNKPYSDKNGHGTEVLGVCAASSNNSLGIAGTGYNSKYMPIKIYKSEDDSFAFGYEAIVYAADKGCKVINLSWGDYRGGFSNFVQDIINYAALEKDVVIVAAAGNTSNLLNFYPASYNNVLSVGATDANDNKTTWGTFSYHIDLMAPGQAVYTTKNDGSYGFSQGSSFSAPIVSGAAALVRSKFPELNALQVIERLRVSADDIYHIPYNQTFKDQLGKGRLNMHRAVSDFTSPAIRMINFKYKNKYGNYAFPGDTISIEGTFINYLSPSNNVIVSISSSSPYVTVLNGTFNLGNLGTLLNKDNLVQPFKIILKADTPPGTHIPLRLYYEDGIYNDFQVFEFETTPDYLTVNNSRVGLTISGNGNLGYHNDDYMQGTGFTYMNKKILDFMGVMFATDPQKVYNNVIHRFDNKKRNTDFTTISPIKLFNNGSAFLEARSQFEDNSDELTRQNLKVDQKLLSFKDLPENDFFILEYRILNNSDKDILDLYGGMYGDWNINNRLRNVVQWDESLKLGYIYDPAKTDLYAGIALLTPQQAGGYAINNKSNTTGDISEDFIFSRTEKYKVLTEKNAQTPAGSIGNEVSHVVSAKLSSLLKNEHVKVAYAIVAGTSLDMLKRNVEAAIKKYNEHLKNPPLIFTTYICEGQSAEINPVEGIMYRFYSDLNLTNLVY
ncbi:MAG: S8 family serine peptidase, partial [Bacteroidota bacterium]|nr:S8 family serine peptidase [Bacteroidota bacterium]